MSVEGLTVHQFPEVTKAYGIDTRNMGAVMVPVHSFDVIRNVGMPLKPDDLYFANDPKLFWIKGNVGAVKAHVTLLYGLIEKAYEQEDLVRDVLSGWDMPEEIPAVQIEVFNSPFSDEPYGCVVARVEHPALLEAHQRLSFLPHINIYPEFAPHVTIAYVKEEAAERWQQALSSHLPVFRTLGSLDLGQRDD